MHLAAMTGPLAGSTLTLADGMTVAGGANGLDANRPSCVVRSSGSGDFVLEVLDRDAPLFLNGLPVTARALEPRDELRIGDTLFIVRADESPAPSPLTACAVHLDATGRGQGSVAASLDAAAVLSTGARNGSREGDDLGMLLRIGAALSSIRGLAALDAPLTALILDAIPIERIVLFDHVDGGVAVRSGWSAARSPGSVDVDGALIERVAKRAIAVIERNEDRDLIAVPMIAFGRVIGVLWGEAAPGIRLDEGHLRLLLVLGGLAAVAREQDREAARLQETNESLQAEINVAHDMVGRSRPMQVLFDRVARVARSEATILLRGESGTGKELVARAVHRNSLRAKRPFIAINCAAITESLLESELFGHEKGAFTGAIGLKKGKLELADGGTLFLDEIGELPLVLQAKLLRALQEREFERVGGTRPIRVDFRLVAATNRDLEAAVRSGSFRQDLFYRLNVVTLSLPPLRERPDDIPILAEHFVRKHAPRCGRQVLGLAPDVLPRLAAHDWPGNVRELENVVEQALALGSSDRIVAEDLPPSVGAAASPLSVDAGAIGSEALNYHDVVERTKCDLIVQAFERAGNSHAVAARLLGVHPNYLHRLLRNLNLRERVGR